MKKTVLELDLAGYSDIARELEENLSVQVVPAFNNQIQGFVEAGLAAVGATREQVVMATTGDGAILAFDSAEDAHRCARAVHEEALTHNLKATVASAKRWFRTGAATGELVVESRRGGRVIAGTVIANAVRLEAAAKVGQLLVDVATFSALPMELQAQYEEEEEVAGKRNEKFRARRCAMITGGCNASTSPTVLTVVELFDQLNPRNQIQRLAMLIEMPADVRPPDTLPLHRQQDQLLDWANNQRDGLEKLYTKLNILIERQHRHP